MTLRLRLTSHCHPEFELSPAGGDGKGIRAGLQLDLGGMPLPPALPQCKGQGGPWPVSGTSGQPWLALGLLATWLARAVGNNVGGCVSITALLGPCV
jgi:hypothetical protein